MQILKGTKREITLMEWSETINKALKKASNSADCFNCYHSIDDLQHLKEDAEKIIHLCDNAAKAIKFMDANNIR